MKNQPKSPSTIKARAKELRRPLTPQERTLWQRLRNRQLNGLKFRRQHFIHHFILDFYCHEHQLAVEIDGDSHAEPAQLRYDQARTEWLAEHGIRVIRFTNREVEHNLAGVLAEIGRGCGGDPSPSP